jgi:hypothetical protein
MTAYCIQRYCFENTVLRRVFGQEERGNRGREKTTNKELYALYCSPNIIRVIKSRRLRLAGHIARMGERRAAYRALVGKTEGRTAFGRPRRKWEDY